jgi:cell pole-organizing protein PopZ
MEEILASIRRIIADDDVARVPVGAAEPDLSAMASPVPPQRAMVPPLRPASLSSPSQRSFPDPAGRQDDLAAELAELTRSIEPAPIVTERKATDVMELTETMAVPAKPRINGAAMGETRPEKGFAEKGFAEKSHTDHSHIDHNHTDHSVADRGVADARADDGAREREPVPAPVAPRRPAPPAVPEPEERPRSLMSSTTSAAVDSAFSSLTSSLAPPPAQSAPAQNSRSVEDLVKEMLRPMLTKWLDDNLPGLVERLVRAEIERVARGR